MLESLRRSEWRDRVAAFERSGLQRGVWCARHGFKVATLDHWRQQFAPNSAMAEQRLIPIQLDAALAAGVGVLTIDIGGGVCLHAGRDVDAAWLALLLRGLR